MTAFKQNENENAGLAYYEQDFQTVSGNALQLANIDTVKFDIITTLLSKKLSEKSTAMENFTRAASNLNYVSDFLTDYMKIAGTGGYAFTMSDMDEWVTQFERIGYSTGNTRILLTELNKLNQSGQVPKEIMRPDKKTADILVSQPTGEVLSQKKLFMMAGAGVLGLGVLIIVLKKRRRK